MSKVKEYYINNIPASEPIEKADEYELCSAEYWNEVFNGR